MTFMVELKIGIPKELMQRLRQAKLDTGLPMAYIVRNAIKQYLDESEEKVAAE